MILARKDFELLVQKMISTINYPYNKDFTHVHLHTEFSFLDGAGKVSELAKACKETNSPLVMTDHGNVAGTIRAHKECSKQGIDLIRGCEVYIRKGNTDDEEDYEGSYFHLILLPYTKKGFENINYLSSLGYVHGLTPVAGRKVPVIKKEWLEENSDGIVALSACMFGEISANIWRKYPYLELLDRLNPKYRAQLLRVARKRIVKKKVLTKKSGLTVDDLSDLDVLDIIMQKKKMGMIKKILLKLVNGASNEDIIAAAKESDSYLDGVVGVIKYYMGLFDYFYLEIQDHNFVEQKVTALIQEYVINEYDLGTKLVITNDVHYVKSSDWEVQDVLLCISTKKKINDKGRFKFNEHELYLKTSEEMMQMFNYLDEKSKKEYMANATEVTHICLNYKLEFDEMFYPAFDIPEGFDSPGEYMMYLCIEGAKEIGTHMDDTFRYKIFNDVDYKFMRDTVYSKIDFETSLEMVKDAKKQAQIIPMIIDGIKESAEIVLVETLRNMGIPISTEWYDKYLEAIERVVYEYAIIVIKQIPDYFLITKQIIDFARNDNILVGPGRGSAAGSVVAYLLGIVELDPIDYSLYFERFINPERNSYPDIDSDFPQRHLRHVRNSTAEYFGVENCCGVNAFGNIQKKRAIQDSFRVFEFTPTEYNNVSKEISNEKDILDSIMENKKLREQYMSESDNNMFAKAVDIAISINGNVRQAGTHAAGMIITPKDVDMFRKLPVMITGGRINSQYDKNDVEEGGFLKMDLLGIRNLDIIQDTIDFVKKYRSEDINIRAISLKDEKTYQLYREGDTDFVFQVESGGMKDFLRKLNPRDIEDIICILAGYRPGPMAYLDQFVKVRNGQEEAMYRHELLKPILEVTGGISFYQEQIMDIFKSLAGYSLGRADLVRRALGKKKKEILDQEKHNFIYGIQAKDEEGNLMFEEDGVTPVMDVKGCVNNGIDEETASLIYEDILPFANYGFNKSHAAGYAILSYRTAYLKANYFLEYATSVLKSVQTDDKVLNNYASIVRSKGVEILFPDINKSNMDMDIYDFENRVISTGLMAIKGMPEEPALAIINERENNGLFSSYDDFLHRMMKHGIDKKSITSLIHCGAFDCFSKNGKLLLDIYIQNYDSDKKIEELKTGSQKTIFDVGVFDSILDYLKVLPDSNGYSVADRLAGLCESNNVGIHKEISLAYKNIRSELKLSDWGTDDEYEAKQGVLSGILQDKFESSKTGKAYLNKMTTFDGDEIKLIITKSKIDSICTDINEFKAGMAIDVTGSFKFPRISDSDESASDEDSSTQAYSNNEIVAFPKKMSIKEIGVPFAPIYVEVDFDEMCVDKQVVVDYHGEESYSDVVSKVLAKVSNDATGKVVIVRNQGIRYTNAKKIIATMDDIKKLGCKYRFV